MAPNDCGARGVGRGGGDGGGGSSGDGGGGSSGEGGSGSSGGEEKEESRTRIESAEHFRVVAAVTIMQDTEGTERVERE